jgi:hypothetical protein
MSPMLREQGIVTIQDQVVSLVAQRWAKAFHYPAKRRVVTFKSR